MEAIMKYIIFIVLLCTFGCVELFAKTPPPKIVKQNITDYNKINLLCDWFINNDTIGKEIQNRSTQILFKEGYRIDDINISEARSAAEYLSKRVFGHLKELKQADKAQFEYYIDDIMNKNDRYFKQALLIGVKYNINYDHFVYEKELAKIKTKKELEEYKYSTFVDTLNTVEARILMWIYHDIFDEWYIAKEPNVTTKTNNMYYKYTSIEDHFIIDLPVRCKPMEKRKEKYDTEDGMKELIGYYCSYYEKYLVVIHVIHDMPTIENMTTSQHRNLLGKYADGFMSDLQVNIISKKYIDIEGRLGITVKAKVNDPINKCYIDPGKECYVKFDLVFLGNTAYSIMITTDTKEKLGYEPAKHILNTFHYME